MRYQGDGVRFISAIFSVAILGVFCLALGCSSSDGGIRRTETGTALIEPESFIFPKLGVGAETEAVVSVKNTGTGVLKLANLRGEFTTEYSLYWYRGVADDKSTAVQINGIIEGENFFPQIIEVEPDESVTFVMAYIARTEDSPVGRLTYDTNEKGRVSVTIPITGDDIGPQLVISPPALDFGRIEAGTAKTLLLNLTNTGQATLGSPNSKLMVLTITQ